jgi:hypothetical protein
MEEIIKENLAVLSEFDENILEYISGPKRYERKTATNKENQKSKVNLSSNENVIFLSSLTPPKSTLPKTANNKTTIAATINIT